MLDIPEKYKNDTIFIVSSRRELIAYSFVENKVINGKKTLVRSPWKVKVESCSGCGQCCKECVFVTNKGCRFGSGIPFNCLVSDCSRDYDQCTERFIDYGVDSK